ncbi:MAG: hypothetical protein ACXVGN_00255 [Mycobacteriaceae bacterium]
MSDVAQVKVAALVVDGTKTYLELRTVEDVDIRFELDDVALGLLGLTVRSVMQLALGREPRVFTKEK